MNECFLVNRYKNIKYTHHNSSPTTNIHFPIFNFSDTAKSIAASLFFVLSVKPTHKVYFPRNFAGISN